MIILRQKLYSSLLAKTLYRTGKLKNRLTTLPARLTRDLHSGGLYKDLGRRSTADARVKDGTKSNIQLKREAIQGDRKIKSSILEAANSSTTKEGVMDYAGKSAGNFVQTAAENPITTAGIAVGYGTTPIQIATGTYWGPIGSASTATEQFLKRKLPKYKQATERLTKVSNKRHWKDKAGGAVKSILVPIM